MAWGFYGRESELTYLKDILSRDRWFFVKITGRRRIGKTALIQQALTASGGRPVYYLQIPDSGPVGVLSAAADAMGTFGVDPAKFKRPTSLSEFAKFIASLARAGYVVALDEFQYFNRERLRDFCSMLQREVDALSSKAPQVKGGLLVLGSLHLEMSAILEDRSAPLYNRTTDELLLGHLDTSSLVTLLRAHADATPERLLFLWTLFEGVPKFYRDCYEQGVLGADRKELLNRIFFQSSSPLRTEADNWFLKELHGRYDVVLKYIARNPGCTNGELTEHVKQTSPESSEQVGGYLKVLLERYAIVERKLPIFAAKKERRGRYYLTDNFLRAWLAALASPASAINFVPVERLVDAADQKLQDLEGFSLEKLSAQLYEERSRKSVGDFPLTARIQGYWDRAGTEIDLVALDEDSKRIRFCFCKRADEKLVSDLFGSEGHIARFLAAFPKYDAWTTERVGIAPTIRGHVRHALGEAGYISQDVNDLIDGL